MGTSSANVVICGAGIAGVSAAYHLAVKHGVKDILLVDERSPLTLTSDKSSECYRNWWPGPDNAMVSFMNRSIDLIENLAEESDNYFHLNRRGYVFLTADPDRASAMKQMAEEISRLGAGPLRYHYGQDDDPDYPPAVPYGYDPQLTGADLVFDQTLIRRCFPFITDRAIAMIHVRRCGWLSAQQFGMYLLQQAKSSGVKFINGRITGVKTSAGQIETIHVDNASGPINLSTRTFVIAAGPLLRDVGAMVGIDFPVFNELHGKVAFNDTAGIISREAPLMIWQDPVAPYWSEDERRELESSEDTRWLLQEFPSGVHCRPEGGSGSQTILALWTYDVEVHEPVFPPAFKDEYLEIVIRGLARMIPGLIDSLEKLSRPVVDGGYYCKTRENRPLIGPLPVKGAYVIGALSGFGIMAAMAAGELLAKHVTGDGLPEYAPSFLLDRYEDPDYQKLLEKMQATSGQL
ncbi:MAG: FAD-binding oxidoreductase [Deltaproteobacteria bacterium]|nr:FAD-binding oxidoreductase [Deltaproteobacteria bacterium]MBW1962123.1 FAD-binding oxidoreductase [Deltaproteobacteria bacterium]MBW2152833.1 FAD-binding oxidoreductase [Deltaproteobacteria bacterium]